MSLHNLNNFHLTKEEKAGINTAITHLEQLLEKKRINLSADERKKYGSVNEQNKLFINKVGLYAESQPDLRSPDVKWDEFFADRESRNFVERVLMRLENLATTLRNAKILHDYDNYHDSLNDYAYTSYKAGIAVGYETKLNDLKQFFPREGKKKTKE